MAHYGESLWFERGSGDIEPVAVAFKGINVVLQSDVLIDRDNLLNLEEAVTGMEVLQELPEICDARLVYKTNDEINVDYSEAEGTMMLTGPAARFGQGTTLAFIAQYMAECHRAARQGSMLVHSAAVKAPDQDVSYLFLGDKGAGKTTLALRMCHEYGCHLIGNDQVFVGANASGQLATNGGNAWFHVRETAIAADVYLQDLLGYPESDAKPAWNNKIKVDPAEIGVKVHDGYLPLGGLYRIRIDHSQREARVVAWDDTNRNLILHELLGRHITGQATPLQDDKGEHLGSLPPVRLHKALRARDRLLDIMVNEGIQEIFTPSCDLAVEYIARQELQ